MKILAFPVLVALIAIPGLTGLSLRFVSRPATARVAALVAAATTLALAVLTAIVTAPLPTGTWVIDPFPTSALVGHPLFGVDAFSSLLMPITTLVPLGIIIAGPRQHVDTARLSTVLLTEAATLGMLASLDLILVTAFAIAMLLPTQAFLRDAQRKVAGRVYLAFLLTNALSLVLGTAGIVATTWSTHGAGALDLRHVEVASTLEPVIFALFITSVFARMALFPMHSWLPLLLERGPLGTGILLISAQSGAYLLVRVALPFFPEKVPHAAVLLATAGIISALYGAILALGQRDLRRLVGWLTVSQSGLLVAGLCSQNAEGLAGAFLYAVSYATAVAGLSLVVWAIEARTGTVDIHRLQGLSRSAPRLATAFVIFAVASVGFPGSLGFVAEDMLVHGMLERYPSVAALMVLVTAINGIALLRVFMSVFLREPRRPVPDARTRELGVYVLLGSAAFLLGLAPQWIVSFAGRALHAMPVQLLGGA